MIQRWWNQLCDLYYDVYGFVVRLWYYVYGFVVRLWYYLPIIWRDRDYDWAYALRLLRFKLSRISDCVERSRWSGVKTKRRTRHQIYRVNELIRRIVNEDYLRKEWQIHFKKYPFDLSASDSKTSRRSRHALCARSDRLLERDWKRLWQLLNKNMRNWWD